MFDSVEAGESKEEKVKEHYNGYNFMGEVVYNPHSVLSYMDTGEFRNFWLGSSSNDLAKQKVEQLLEISGDEIVRKMMEDLLQGKKVKMEVNEVLRISKDMEPTDILNLLLYSGYLKYENYKQDGDNVFHAEVSIPNLEIKAIYRKTINEWVKGKYTMEEIEELKKFFRSVCEGEKEEIRVRLERYLDRRSMMDGEKISEMGYHNFLFGLLQGLENRYLLDSNKESGAGRFDVMLTPVRSKIEKNDQRKGVVIKLKVGEKQKLKKLSEEAIRQMEDKRYYKNLEDKELGGIRLIGIAFNGKEAEVLLKEIKINN